MDQELRDVAIIMGAYNRYMSLNGIISFDEFLRYKSRNQILSDYKKRIHIRNLLVEYIDKKKS